MKAKFGAIVVDGRGKIGGHVASKNKAGSYFRTKVTPTNPNSSFQSSVRKSFGDLAQSWRGLTQSQRASWNAGAVNFPYVDIFGDSKQLSGFGLYMQLNGNLNTVGAALLTNCPSPSAVSSINISEFLWAAADDFSLNGTPTPTPAGHAVVVSVTPILSPGRALSKSQIRQLAVFPAAQVLPLTISDDYVPRFGAIPAGSNVYAGAHLVNLLTGQVSQLSMVRMT